MTRLLPHPGKQVLFALLSLTDLALTCWLLGRGAGRVYEANPLAGWFLARHGLAGLVCFKAAVVLLVFALAAAISGSRPSLAGRILALGCAGLLVVVLYSAVLCRGLSSSPVEGQARARQGNRSEEEFGHRFLAKQRRKEALLADLRQGLVAGRYTLGEAVRRLADSEPGRDPTWLRRLTHLHPNGSLEARLGAFLIMHVVSLHADQPQLAWRAALRLERQFDLLWGPSWPRAHRDVLRGPEPEAGDDRPLDQQ
jgi:hypothetical protein